ncbi:MAG: hypothetical protein ACLRPZ_04120 [Coprococcus sp.]
MGKSRSYEILEFKKKIMGFIVKSPELIKLLDEENSEYPEDTIPYNKSFPHEYVPDTVETTKKFINYDIDSSLDYRNNTFRNITVYFFVHCHKKVTRYSENSIDTWYDLVVCQLDEIMSTQDILGVGEMELVSNKPYSPQAEFVGRLLVFKAKDYTNGKKYGK